MKTILISGASAIIGYGIAYSIKNLGYRTVGITTEKESPANFFCDIFEQAPYTSDSSYIPWLIDIIHKHNINMLFPGIEQDMIAWNLNKKEIEKTGAIILFNNEELIYDCTDKWKFYQKLINANSPYAIPTKITGNFNELVHEFKLPFLLKPRRGYASKGIVLVNSYEEFAQNQEAFGSFLMAQPIIGDNEHEFTVSAFFDKNSKLCAFQQLKRKLSRIGYTDIAEVVEIPNMENALLSLAQIFKPIGPTNFQFRMKDNHLYLLEINPRISSATSIRTAFGYNESKMSIDYFLHNISITQPYLKKGKAIRYIENHIEYDSNNI